MGRGPEGAPAARGQSGCGDVTRPRRDAAGDDLLEAVLRDAQARGFLGSGEPLAFIRHARGYLDGLTDATTADGVEVVDLGSGNGLPGLVLAIALPETVWHLVERSRARADWLRRVAERVNMAERVTVHHEPAELTGRGRLRGRCSAVVARRFAGPAVAAECAAPLLVLGGRAVFSDLDAATRWDDRGLAQLGLAMDRTWSSDAGTYVALEQRSLCSDRFPRSPGVPVRRPLF